MKIIIILVYSIFLSLSAFAGEITIEKSDSLIRNDVFDQKRERAEEYKAREAQRNANNERWTSGIPASCGLLRNSYFVYFCATSGRYYKGYESGEYRELSNQEVKKLSNAKD